MREFLHSKRFKILLAVFAVLVGFMLYAASTEGSATLPGKILSAITAPLQKLSSSISGTATGFLGNFTNAGKTAEENKKLREEIAKLREELVDFETYKAENKQLNEMIGLKEANEDFEMANASVIARDPADRFSSFQIDKGSIHGVSFHDPVISSDGLVGYVTQVNATSSRVTTILSPEINVGAYGVHSNDTGVLTGDAALSQKGYCKLQYLLRETGIAKGDTIVTTGVSGIFPKGLVIGTVEEVKPESHGASVYAVVNPAADIENLKDVFIITDFLGQGGDAADTTSGNGSSGGNSSKGTSSQNASSGNTSSGGSSSKASSGQTSSKRGN